MTQTFPFRFDEKWRLPLLAVAGATPRNSRVVVTDTHLDARFGRFRLKTPLSNCKDTQITRDYAWFKAIGPRASFADWGVTFGSNTEAGLCICFHEPVGALVTKNIMRHPGMTVTVEDVEGLQAALAPHIGRTGPNGG